MEFTFNLILVVVRFIRVGTNHNHPRPTHQPLLDVSLSVRLSYRWSGEDCLLTHILSRTGSRPATDSVSKVGKGSFDQLALTSCLWFVRKSATPV